MHKTHMWTGLKAAAVALAMGTMAMAPSEDASAWEGRVLEHRTDPVPGLGMLTVQVWTDGVSVQVSARDLRGRIVVLREGMAASAGAGRPAPSGTAMAGRLPARARTFEIKDGAITHTDDEDCGANASCAQNVADEAHAIAAATMVMDAVSVGENTMLVRVVPLGDAEATGAYVTDTAWIRTCVATPYRWETVSMTALVAQPGIGRTARVLVNDQLYAIEQATWRPVHGTRWERLTALHEPSL